MSRKGRTTTPARLRFVPLLLTALAAAGCASTPATPERAPRQEPGEALPDVDSSLLRPAEALPDADTARFRFHVLAGELAGARGDPDSAAEHLLEAARLSESAEIARRGAQFAIAARRNELALELAEIWEATGEADELTNELLLRLALDEGNTAEAQRRAARFVDTVDTGDKPPWQALAQTMSAGGTPDAVAVMQTLVQERAPESTEAHYALGLMALHFNEYDVAATAARTAVDGTETGEARDRYLLLLAGALIQGEGPETTERTLAPLLATAHEGQQVRHDLADLYMQQEAWAQARRVLEQALAETPADAELRLSHAEAARGMGDSDTWRATLQDLLDEGGDAAFEAAYRLAHAAEEDGDIPEARRWYERAYGGDRDAQIGLRLAQLDADAGDLDGARDRLTRLRREHPGLAARLLRAEGELLYEARAFDKAVDVLETGLALYPRDEHMRYSYALALEQAGDFPEAERQLDILLTFDPDNASALNALGYMLTIRDDRLHEARAYIERALEILPDDPAVIDSMGWVLYRLGESEQALVYLERAYQELQEPEIAAHLGEVLWALGQRERAREVWRAAFDEDAEHPVLMETVQRLDPRLR